MKRRMDMSDLNHRNGSFFKRRLGIIIAASVALIIIIAVTICAIMLKKSKKILFQERDRKVDELIRRSGEYDKKSIVLTNINPLTAEKLAKKTGASLRISYNGKFATLTLPSEKSIIDVFSDDAFIKDINKMSADWVVYTAGDDDITLAEDELIENENASSEINMQKIPQYEVTDTLFSSQSYINYLNLENVWERSKGMAAKIAIIDTGIDYTHPEFDGRISDFSYDCSNDQVVRDYGYSVIEDYYGHGTRVAGVIAASIDGAGTVGIAPEAELLVIRADTDQKGNFRRVSDLIFGMYYAIEQDVDIINMSFAVPSDVDMFKEVIQLAVDSDIICIAAAGNKGDCGTYYPAANPNVIGVGAMNESCIDLWENSNYGDNLDVVAPGYVFTTNIGGEYITATGTSMAAASVTGAAALYCSINQNVEVKDFRENLFASCTDLGDKGKDYTFGYGMIDIAALTIYERGKITFDYLTDELSNTTQLFVKNKVLQNIPFPERNYAAFDGWYYDDQMSERYNLFEDMFLSDLTLYANWGNEDDGIPYIYVILDDDTVEIRGYTGHRRFIVIPDYIEDRIVSSIGDSAFKDRNELREVVLPKYLKNIGPRAFLQCTNLVKIDIPDGVKNIGAFAFSRNQRLSNVSFGENSALETVDIFAFSYCGRLASFNVGPNVNSINATAFFADTRLASINTEESNANYKSIEGILYNKQGTSLVAFPAGYGTAFVLPTSVDTICDCSFAYAGITEIDLANVTSIGGNAFVNSKLTTLVIPDTVTQIGNGAFKSNLQLSSVTVGRGISSITDEMFSGDTLLSTIEIPDTVSAIGNKAFQYSGLEQISFTSSVGLQTIGSYAFSCTPLKEIEIPGTVETIGTGAFFKSQMLSQVEFQPYGALMAIGESAFEDAIRLHSIELPNNLLIIENDAFFHSGLLDDLTVPSSVVRMGTGVFSAAPLSNINMADNGCYKSVDGVLYTSDCKELLAYPCGNSRSSYIVLNGTEVIQRKAFCAASNLLSLELPDSLITISTYAFNSMHHLSDVTIPKNVVSIGAYAFSFTERLNAIPFAEDSVISRLGFAAFAYSGLESFTVPSSVSSMGQEVFTGSEKLESIEFDSGSILEKLAAYTFNGCSRINSITFGDNCALNNIEAHALEGLTRLEILDLSGTDITKIGNFAFRFCSSLRVLSLPSGLISIGRYAFYNCKSLDEVTIPESLEFIGRFAFLGTNRISLYFASEYLPETLQEDWDYGTGGYFLGVQSVEENDNWKYANLTNGGIAILSYKGNETSVDLTDPSFNGNVVNIGGYAFAYTDVESVVIPETVQTIQHFAFFNSKLSSVYLPANVSFIGKKAFAFTPIETLSFEIGSHLSTIEQSAFEGTGNLSGVVIPASVKTLGRAVFKNSGIADLSFESGIAITEIPKEAFSRTNITSLAIPDSVEVIWDNAFRETKELQTVSFGEYPDLKIRSNAFYDSGLCSLVVPESVSYIGEYAFGSLKNLNAFEVSQSNPYYKSDNGMLLSKDGRRIISAPCNAEGTAIVPAGVEVIGFGAFENSSFTEIIFPEETNILTFGNRAFFGMKNLTSFTVPSSVVSIDFYAFAYCDQLRTVRFEDGCLIKGIYEGAFCGDYRLADIVIPDSIVEISDFAFYGCEAITSIPMSDSCNLKGIYSYAMAYTGLMDELAIPDSVIDIGEYAFLGTEISSLKISNTNASELMIGIGAFENCRQLESISIPFVGSSLYAEDNAWFSYIFGAGDVEVSNHFIPSSLKTVELLEGSEIIGPNAFRGIRSDAQLILPSTISELYEGAFYECKMRFEIDHIVAFSKLDEREIYVPDNCPDSRYFFDSWLTGIDFSGSGSGVLTAFDDYTFWMCSELVSVKLPADLLKIGDGVFYYCQKLDNVTIPESVTEIGMNSFGYCEALKKAIIPDSVVTLGEKAFGGSGLEELYVGRSIKTIPDSYFENFWSLRKVTLANVETIGKMAFNACISLEEINLGESLKTVGDYAFDFCGSFKTLVLPSTLESIGECAFSSNIDTIINNSILNLNFDESNGQIALNANMIVERDGTIKRRDSQGISITTPEKLLFEVDEDKYHLIAYVGNDDTVTLPVTVEGHAYTLRGIHNVKNIIVPEGITDINDFAFEYSNILENVTLPSTITRIGEGAFHGCVSLKHINIPNGIEEIGAETFADCGLLESIEFPDTISVIGNSAFRGCNKMRRLVLPNGLTGIEEGAFNDCTGLEEIILPNTVEYLGANAFRGCSSLEEIVLPESVEYLGWSVFYGCKNLSNVTLSEQLNGIPPLAFSETAIERIIIPDSCTSIESEAFGYCERLEWINIPKNVWGLAGNAFAGCKNLDAVMIDQANENFTVQDGIVYSKDLTGMFLALPDCEPEIVLPTSIRYISEGAFNNPVIESVIVPETESEIEGLRFENCSNLKYVELPDGMVHIPSFCGCTSLEEVRIPETARDFGGFIGCASLKSIYLPEGVTEVPDFGECSSLTSLVLPSSVRSFRGWFYKCESLEYLCVPEGVTTIPAFWECRSLKRIDLPSTITSFENGTFSGCSSLESFDWPSNIDSIPEEMFRDCQSLTGFVFPDTVHSIGRNAFLNSGLVTLTIPDSISGIDTGAFALCKQLERVVFPASIEGYELPDNIFRDCEKLSSVILPDNLNGISPYSFEHCKSLKTISIPESVRTIGACAFNGSGLERLVLPEGLSVIESDAFRFCEDLLSIDIKSCDLIEQNAFQFCTNLVSVKIPEGITSIREWTFSRCENLLTVEIPASVTSIEDGAFFGCHSLILAEYGDDVVVSDSAFAECPVSDDLVEKILINDGFVFLKQDGQYYLRGFIGNSSEIVLPELGPEGAPYTLYKFRGAKKVTVPGSIGIIPAGAFERNPLLEEVVLEEGIEFVGWYAFSLCVNLRSITLPETLHTIDGGAFDWTRSLKHIDVPDSVETIGDAAFFKSGIEDFVMPPRVKSIGIHTFAECMSLAEFVVPEGIESIGSEAFNNCEKLTQVSLPSTLKVMGSNVFGGSGLYYDQAYWTDDYFMVDGWICEVKSHHDYFALPDNYVGIAQGAYRNASHLKFAYNNCSDLSNAESVLITDPQIERIMPIIVNIPVTLKNVIISENTQIVSADAFLNMTGITIYVEASEKDCRWDENYPGWNNGNRVLYGDDWAYSTFYGVNGELVYKAPRAHSKVVLRPYYRLNRNLKYEYNTAWDINADGIPDALPATSVDDIVAHAIITEKTLRKYAVRYYDYDGSILYEQEVNYGDPVPVPPDPERDGTESLDYSFYRWVVIEGNIEEEEEEDGFDYIDPELTPNSTDNNHSAISFPANGNSVMMIGSGFVRGDEEFVSENMSFGAKYSNTYVEYVVTFVDWDGTVISRENYHYWDTVNVPADPERTPDIQHSYVFTGWDKEISKVTEDVIYTAEYGETEPEIDLIFSHSCTFANDLTLNYYIKTVDLQEYEEFYLVVEKDCYSSDGVLLPERKTITLYGEPARLSGVDYYKFKYKGIASYELGDNCYAVLHAFKDGIEYVSAIDEYSLKTYAYNRLTKSTDAEFKTLLVDLLNYCSQSQIYFDYRADALVNADLSADQLALASPAYAELVGSENVETLENASVTYYGKTVVFGSNIEIKIYVKLNGFSGNRDDLVMRFEYTGTYGLQTIEVPYSEFAYRTDYDAYSAKLIDIAMYDARTPIRITVLENNVPVSDTITYSIETYAKNRLEKSGDEVFKELLRMTMKYADSANLYFEHHH